MAPGHGAPIAPRWTGPSAPQRRSNAPGTSSAAFCVENPLPQVGGNGINKKSSSLPYLERSLSLVTSPSRSPQSSACRRADLPQGGRPVLKDHLFDRGHRVHHGAEPHMFMVGPTLTLASCGGVPSLLQRPLSKTVKVGRLNCSASWLFTDEKVGMGLVDGVLDLRLLASWKDPSDPGALPQRSAVSRQTCCPIPPAASPIGHRHQGRPGHIDDPRIRVAILEPPSAPGSTHGRWRAELPGCLFRV